MLFEQLKEIQDSLETSKLHHRSTNQIEKKYDKYCKYHMTKSHSTEKCRALSKKKKDKKKPTNHMIQEVSHPTNPLTIPISVQCSSLTALIDTGASGNYISDKIAKDIDIQVQQTPKPSCVTLDDASTTTIKQMCNVKFNIENLQSTSYENSFDVLQSENPTFILGMPFLQSNNCIIDLETKILTVDKQPFELNTLHSTKILETTLLDKAEINSIKSDKQNFKELITKFKENNPHNGDIRIAEHTIELVRTPKSNRKQYTVSLKIKSDVEDFLDDLEGKKIIRKCVAKFVSPTFFIKKKNGELRLVVDYRAHNACTMPQKFPLPKSWDQLIQLKGSQVFSQIDLKSGYYQIRMYEKDKVKTVFMIAKRHICSKKCRLV